MKFSDHFIARDFRLGAAEHLEGAMAREIRGFAGHLFDCRDEFGVETQAFSAERNQRRSFRRIRARRQHSGSGPGSFAAWLLAIEHRHAQFFGRKLEGDRATDQSAANDDYVVSAHQVILSGIAMRISRSRTAPGAQSGINLAASEGMLGAARNSACERARRCAFKPTKSTHTPGRRLFMTRKRLLVRRKRTA